MEIAIDLRDPELAFDITTFALDSGVWDGYEITAEDASEFRLDAEEKILEILFSQNPAAFEQMAHFLAQVGEGREIEYLEETPQAQLAGGVHGEVALIGFKKTMSKFWKKHKVKILIGVAILAVVTTVVVVAACSAAAIGSGAAAAGGGALGSCAEEERRRRAAEPLKNEPAVEANPPPPPPQPLASASEIPASHEPTLPFNPPEFPLGLNGVERHPVSSSIPNTPPVWSGFDIKTPTVADLWIDPKLKVEIQHPSLSASSQLQASLIQTPSPILESDIFFVKDGVQKDGQFISYRDMIDQSKFDEVFSHQKTPFEMSRASPPVPDNRSVFRSWMQKIGESQSDPDLLNPNAPMPYREMSRFFEVHGNRLRHLGFGWINGINNSFGESLSSAHYIQQFSQGMAIDGTFNKSNSVFMDLLEVIFLNYSGFSPNTAELLAKRWTDFHERNKDNPNAKYLQFGHSQGCIQIYNGLQSLPKEIRDRVIVVAIAPAMIIPPDVCFESYNYVSEKDLVPQGQIVRDGFLGGPESEHVDHIKKVYMDNVILLKAHPDATGIDHAFNSPTYEERIMERIEDYINKYGELEYGELK